MLFKNFLIAIFLMVMLACNGSDKNTSSKDDDASSNELEDLIEIEVIDYSILPAIRPIKNDQAFVVVFSQSMKVDSIELTGDLSVDDYTALFSQTNVENDTLTLTPTTVWSTGQGLSLNLSVEGVSDNSLASINATFDVYGGSIYFVDANAADNSGDGTSHESSKQSIQAAIDVAIAPATIVVNEGLWLVNASADTNIKLKAGVSIYGAYNSTFTDRDNTLFTTEIRDITDTATGQNNAALEAVDLGNIYYQTLSGLTIKGSSETGVDNSMGVYSRSSKIKIVDSTVLGGDAESSTAIYANTNTTMTISDSKVMSGAASVGSSLVVNGISAEISIYKTIIIAGNAQGASMGLFINTPQSVEIVGNDIYAGEGIAGSIGIFSVSAATIANNRIYGGVSAASTTYGIDSLNWSSNIFNNIIHGGEGMYSQAVRIRNGFASVVRNNTIFTGVGSTSTYGIISNESTMPAAYPTIENNIIFTTSSIARCIHEWNINAGFAAIRNNAMWGCDRAIYRDADAQCVGNGDGDDNATTCTLDEMELLADYTGLGAMNNLELDAMFVDIDGPDNDIQTMDDNNWQPTAPGVLSGGLNGIDEGWLFTTDYTGAVRPGTGEAWSIGAHQ